MLDNKLIKKLIESILQITGYVDGSLQSNTATLETLIQSGLISYWYQLNGKNDSTTTSDIVKPEVVNCVNAITLICINCPSVLIQPYENKSTQQVSLYYKTLIDIIIKFYKFNYKTLSESIDNLIETVINLLTIKIHSFKVRKNLRTYIINTLFSCVSKAFNESRLLNSNSTDLIISIQFFIAIFNQQSCSNLDITGSLGLKFNKLARKIWYLLTKQGTVGILENQDQFIIRFLSSSFANFNFFNKTKDYSNFVFCFELSNSLIKSLCTYTNTCFLSHEIQIHLAKCLLELYSKCLENNISGLFYAQINFNDILLIKNENTSKIHTFFIHVINLIIKNPQYQNELLANSINSKFERYPLEYKLLPYYSNIEKNILCYYNDTMRDLRLPQLLNIIKTQKDEIIEISIVNYKMDNYLDVWISNLQAILQEDGSSILGTSLGTLKLIQSLGHFACLLRGKYNFQEKCCEVCEDIKNTQIVRNKRLKSNNISEIQKLLDILNDHIIEFAETNDTLTINLLLTLKKIFIKYTPSDVSEDQKIFKFLKNCMCSKNRDTRIIAGNVLPLYLLSDDGSDLTTDWEHLFHFLDNDLLLGNENYLAESKILAWGELAVFVDGEFLNVVLAKLFDFLSSLNSFYICTAFSTLLNVASLKKKTPWQLINPFLPTLSSIMVQEIVKKSVFGTIIPELLGASSKDIFFRTTSYTIPYLLTYYSKDVIKEIARVTEKNKYQLVCDNLPKILAVMITSPEYLEFDENLKIYYLNQKKIMDILRIVDPFFRDKQLVDLIDTVADIWEICKMYGVTENNYLHIKNSIIFIIKLANLKTSFLKIDNKYNLSTSISAEDEKILHNQFKSSLLGIVQQFSDVVKSTRGNTPYLEKIKSLNAIEFLVQISRVEIVTALPQICICIQKAISDPLLEFNSLRCFKVLVVNLKDIHLSTCFDLIIAIILQKWKDFNGKSKKVAKDILIELFNKEDLIREKYFNYYFTLSFNENLVEVYAKASRILKSKKNLQDINDKKHSMVLNLLYDITRRCRNDNKYVVRQALVDLKNFLTRYKDDFYSNFLHKTIFIKFVPRLIDILFKNCSKFKSSIETEYDDSKNIPQDCSECLGIIGSLDPDKFSIKDEEADYQQLSCMIHSAEDLNLFVAQLLNLLVQAFWASEDPGFQIFLAYGMQQFIKLCNFVDVSTVTAFNDLTKSTLTPLTTSMYELNPGQAKKLKHYPLFKFSKNHSEWVREVTIDMIQRSKLSCTEKEIPGIDFYSIYEIIIKGQDLSISLAILPFVVLNMIIKDFEGSRIFIRDEFLLILDTDSENETYTHEMSKNIKLFYQTVFKIVDYLSEWISKMKHRQSLSKKKKRVMFGILSEDAVKIVEEFLEGIPDSLISKRSSQCASYQRAILFLEKSYRELQDLNLGNVDLTELNDLYVKINDFDALSGSLKSFSFANIESTVQQLQYEDNWKSSLGIFETLSTDDDKDLQGNIKYLQYLNSKNLYSETITNLQKVSENISLEGNLQNISTELMNVALKAGILESDKSTIEKWICLSGVGMLTNDTDLLVDLLVAKSLVSLSKNDIRSFEYSKDKCQNIISSSLSLSPLTSLSKNRRWIDRLHILQDLKDLSLAKDKDTYLKLNKIFVARLENVGSDFESSWFILSVKKTGEEIYEKFKDLKNSTTSNLWLQRSKLELEHNRVDLALRSTVQSYMINKNHEAELNYADILRIQGDFSQAIKIVQALKNIETMDVTQKSKVQLKYAHWLESSNNALGKQIVKEFEKAIKLDHKWEDPYYYIGRYYMKIFESQNDKTETVNSVNTVYAKDNEYDNDMIALYGEKVIHYYLKCISYGTRHLQEILPKIVTIWIDLSFKLYSINSSDNKLLHIEEEITNAIKILPKHYWFMVLSQMLSRLPSCSGKTHELIVEICTIVTQYYPQIALWSIFAQYQSQSKSRSVAGKLIIQKFLKCECKVDTYSNNLAIGTQVSKFMSALQKMTKVDTDRQLRDTSLSEHYKFDHNVLPVPLVVPSKRNFEVYSSSDQYKLQLSLITITKFKDQVKVMSSLQRPRRILVLGSDGQWYPILFKLNDDLRKDAKLMELTGTIDQLLKQDYESKKRMLHIKTFAVIPLNETYGIIEWVRNHTTMKAILDKKYERKKPLISLKKDYELHKTLDSKLAYFNNLLSFYKPVLYQWFIEFFPTPNAWYDARNEFSRTCAVMSMVGFVLGIGDRHGENILISETDGSVLHVDFDCLFEKGTTLRVPERVPFRLTNNMVNAFGISGIEGTYRKSSEVTMLLLRGNESIFMNILEAFIHDPIMEWKSNKLGSPETTLAKTRAKLRGIMEKESLPMSISGQVNYLIEEATSEVNLCRMYFGWLPFW